MSGNMRFRLLALALRANFRAGGSTLHQSGNLKACVYLPGQSEMLAWLAALRAKV